LATTLLTFAPISQSVAAPGDNAVAQWNQTALDIIVNDADKRSPSRASLYVAMVQAAVYDAVMAIEGTNEPYAFDGDAPGASADAAVAAAARGVLVHYFTQPAQVGKANLAYSNALATVPDGAAKDAGVSVGEQAAAAIIALRADDGRNATVVVTDGTEPGQYRRTSAGSFVTPEVGNVTPFLAESPSQFRAPGPAPLTSPQYAREFERTRLYGGKVSLRSPEQTEVALFWVENTVGQYNRALRSMATTRGLSVTDTALLFAMTDIPAADAMITCWNTKYHHMAWRPVTAIQQAATDGNDATTAEPTWEPFSVTGLHPEYTSGHACLTGAISRGLQEFLGTKKIDFSMNATINGVQVTHHFADVGDLRSEVEDARVYGGDHWTSGGTDGTNLGDDLAKWAFKRYFEAA
jgi:hypothetical protein